jgi:hypothetical protein
MKTRGDRKSNSRRNALPACSSKSLHVGDAAAAANKHLEEA